MHRIALSQIVRLFVCFCRLMQRIRSEESVVEERKRPTGREAERESVRQRLKAGERHNVIYCKSERQRREEERERGARDKKERDRKREESSRHMMEEGNEEEPDWK